jgi:hypothetical protein
VTRLAARRADTGPAREELSLPLTKARATVERPGRRPYKVLARTTSAAVLALVFSASADASSITIGAPADVAVGNCFPLGCTAIPPSNRYQQVYHNTLFGATSLLITSIDFFNTQVSPGTNAPSATYDLHLSTTSRPVNGLDTVTLANNVGPDDLLAFSGTIGGVGSIVGGVLRINLTTPFLYNQRCYCSVRVWRSRGASALAGTEHDSSPFVFEGLERRRSRPFVFQLNGAIS